ncbi:MAG: biopolymer transporter ExbD [Nitrospirae bacterium]|nr:biopolymer transporter ExbD [Nitrospirota bacterium]
MPADRRRGDPGRFLAEINVVPLVDVVLVLLIIFMITAPLMYRGIDIDLPRSSVNTIKPEERVVLTVSRDRAVFIDKERVPRIGLDDALGKLARSRPDLTVYLRADRDVPYGTVVEVMDAIKHAGIERLGMITEPASGSER